MSQPISIRDRLSAAASAAAYGALAVTVIPIAIYRGTLRRKANPLTESPIDWAGFGQRAAMAVWPLFIETLTESGMHGMPCDCPDCAADDEGATLH